MTVTVTPTLDVANVPPRVRLSIAASAGETSDTIVRNNPDGTTSVVRTSDGSPQPISGGVALLYDYEAPMGGAVSYYGMSSPGTVSAQVTVPGTQVWLIHPGVPALSMPVKLAPPSSSSDARTFTAPRAVFSVLGRRNVVVITDGARKGENSALTVWARSAQEKASLDALLADSQPLLLNVPTSLGYNRTTKYISVADVEYDSPTGRAYENWLVATLPYDEVDAPAGGSTSQRTYADVLAKAASYLALDAAYPTYIALLAGP